MIVDKCIEVSLNIPSPIDLYSDPENNIIEALRAIYENKCYKSCRIEKILEVVQRSECVIDPRGHISEGRINVKFLAQVTILNKNEVLNGCTITHIDKNMISATNDRASIMLKFEESMSTFRCGQIIPVVIKNTMYNIGSSRISISATPFIPKRTSVCYHIDGKLTTEEKQQLKPAIARLAEETDYMNNNRDNGAYDFFGKLIYPHKDGEKTPGGVKIVDVKTLVDDQTPGWYVRDSIINTTSTDVHRYDDSPNDLNISIAPEVSVFDAIVALLHEYTDRLRIIREMTIIYKDKDVVKSHSNIWKVIHTGKR